MFRTQRPLKTPLQIWQIFTATQDITKTLLLPEPRRHSAFSSTSKMTSYSIFTKLQVSFLALICEALVTYIVAAVDPASTEICLDACGLTIMSIILVAIKPTGTRTSPSSNDLVAPSNFGFRVIKHLEESNPTTRTTCPLMKTCSYTQF